MAEDWDKISEIYAEDTVGQDPAGTIMKGKEENIALINLYNLEIHI